MSEITYGFGLQIATFIIVLLGATYGIFVWYRRRHEKKEYEKLMKDPLEIHFRIPEKSQYSLKYGNQDKGEQTKDELVLPANFEDHIFLILKPKINLRVTESYYGIGYTKAGVTSKKPELSYSNPFIKETSEQPKWMRDSYGCIHFTSEKRLFKDEPYPYLPAFKIRTYDKGEYKFEVIFHVLSSEWKEVKKEIHSVFNKNLILRVE